MPSRAIRAPSSPDPARQLYLGSPTPASSDATDGNPPRPPPTLLRVLIDAFATMASVPPTAPPADAENAPPHAPPSENATAKPAATRKYNTRASSRRVLADIANRGPPLQQAQKPQLGSIKVVPESAASLPPTATLSRLATLAPTATFAPTAAPSTGLPASISIRAPVPKQPRRVGHGAAAASAEIVPRSRIAVRRHGPISAPSVKDIIDTIVADSAKDISRAAKTKLFADAVDDTKEISAAASTCANPALPAGVLDIDAADSDDRQAESGLALVIACTLHGREETLYAPANYLSRHADVSARMRSILIDWLVDVHLQFRLSPETLHLCVNLLDRFLAHADAPIRRSALQLVGVGALFVACKYEEIYAPAADDFVYITDRTYSRAQVLGMEAALCNRLGWRVTVATALPFVRRCVKALRATHTGIAAGVGCNGTCGGVATLAAYAVDLALADYAMLRFRPSRVAAAACALAARLLSAQPGAPRLRWNNTVAFHSGGYAEADLVECAAELARLLEHERDENNSNKLNAVKRKYSAEKHGAVSAAVGAMDVMGALAEMRNQTGSTE